MEQTIICYMFLENGKQYQITICYTFLENEANNTKQLYVICFLKMEQTTICYMFLENGANNHMLYVS